MLFGRDLGIDLGTTNVLISVRNKGVILREPSVVAIDKTAGKLLNVGMAAQRMLGRTPGNIAAILPIRGGAITDYDMSERLLGELVRKISSFSLLKPRMIIAVSSGISEVEERAVIDVGISAGARKVYLLESPVAAAYGAGLDISKPDGHLVIDIGGGAVDIAVLSLSGVVESASSKDGGDAFNDAIIKYIRRKNNILIGDSTAEELKKSIGCVFPRTDSAAVEVKGRCLVTGLPKVVTVTTSDMLDAFEEVTQRIIDLLQSVLENTPPELVADISRNGIVLTGGGSLVWGLDKLIESSTSIPTRIADDADKCVAYGLSKALSSIESMPEGTINLSRRRQMKK